jgi:leucyl aminopeptidase
MRDLSVTAEPGASDLTVVVIGHCTSKLPRLIAAQVARIIKGEASAPMSLVCEDGRFLLVKPDEKPWLVGGENWRVLGKEIVEGARAAKVSSATVLVQGAAANPQALVEGMLLGDYRYNVLRSGKDGKRVGLIMRVLQHKDAIKAGTSVAVAQNLARELADMPPNLLNPQTFAERARKEARKAGLGFTVTSGNRALRKAGFPGLVQVGMAGSAEPALVKLSYAPKRAAPGKHLALVGKGLTFDSGGISLKHGAGMWEMKGDMGGAAAVLGAMALIAEQRPDVAVTGYLCLAENMPDSKAQRPGDIYRARNGKYIHVDNTDAEGRLVLADVLTYAAEQGATHVIDVATLTGGCVIALGDHIAGLLGRGQAFLDHVRSAGQESGEELWQLPLYGEYRDLIDHPHSDVNNIGIRHGSTITSALFLSEFIPDTIKWAHIDMVGPAIQSDGWRYYSKGMTGFATRTLARVAATL